MIVTDFIVCDDIRSELGMKLSLMGIYNDRIRLQLRPGTSIDWPTGIKLGIYIRAEIDSEKSSSAFKLQAAFNDINLLEVTGPLTRVSDSKVSVIQIVVPSFPLMGLGEIHFSLFFSETESEFHAAPNFRSKIAVQTEELQPNP